MPADVDKVQLISGGFEQRIFVKALDGRHSDGSVRSILIQWNAGSQPNGPFGTGEVRFGTTRTTVDIAETAVSLTSPDADRATSGYPAGVCVATDPAFLCSTGIFGSTILPRTTVTAGAPDWVGEIFTDFTTWSTNHWTNWTTSAQLTTDSRALNCMQYDRAAAHLMFAASQGPDATGIEWLRRGLAYHARYQHYQMNSLATQFGSQPHLINFDGPLLHYWLTGCSVSREAIRVVGSRAMTWFTTVSNIKRTGSVGEGRPVGFFLNGLLNAIAVGDTSASYGAKADAVLAQILVSECWDIPAAGQRRWVGCWSGGEQSNFMATILVRSMMRYYRQRTANPTILTHVEEVLNYLWDTQRVTNGYGVHDFNYHTALNTSNCSGNTPLTNDTALPNVDLAGFFTDTFSEYGTLVGSSTWITRGDSSAATIANEPNDGNVGPYYLQVLGKQFNECFRTILHHLALRLG